MPRSQNSFIRFAAKLARHATRQTAKLLDDRRHEDHVHPADPTCPICQNNTVSGVLWPIEINGDRSHQWIARCSGCGRFESDIAAATYLVRLGLVTELGIGYPPGSADLTPFSGRDHSPTGKRS